MKPWTCPRCNKTIPNVRGVGGHMRYCSVSHEEVFWTKVRKTPSCWHWTGARRWDGYGRLQIPGRQLTAHRYSWELVNGPIPEGTGVLHKCDTPGCVNPAHLFLGDQKVNMQDCLAKNRVWRGGNRPKIVDSENRTVSTTAKEGK